MKTLLAIMLFAAIAVAQPITARDSGGNTLDVLTFGNQFYTEGQIAPVEGATLIGVTVTYKVTYYDASDNEIGPVEQYELDVTAGDGFPWVYVTQSLCPIEAIINDHAVVDVTVVWAYTLNGKFRTRIDKKSYVIS